MAKPAPRAHLRRAKPQMHMSNTTYEAVIGLEVHAQLSTRTKLFCRDALAYGAGANSLTSAYTLAMPGTMPRMNRRAAELAVLLGLAMQCQINQRSLFARKNYFYPDLPKGFQTTQHSAPVCLGGGLSLADGFFVPLNRIHLEEDAGKSTHDLYPQHSAIDLNRAGTPLVEIVTEPALHTAAQAAEYLTELRRLLRWLGVCDGNMEQGSLRCDANVSIRPTGSQKLGTKVEIKNLNSIAHLRKAIEGEIARQTAETLAGRAIQPQTRSYAADTNTTFALREKEEANDYRYLTEPDLPALVLSDAFIEAQARLLPTLPQALEKQWMQALGLSAYDAAQACKDRATAEYFTALLAENVAPKAAINWLSGPVRQHLNEQGTDMDAFALKPAVLAALIQWVQAGHTSYTIGSTRLFASVLAAPADALPLHMSRLGLGQDVQVQDAQIKVWLHEALAAYPDKAEALKKGKKQFTGLFVGEVKKKSGGKAHPGRIAELLMEWVG